MQLRKVTPEDLGLLYFWFSKDRIRTFFGNPREWVREIYDHLKNDTDWISYNLVMVQSIPIGFVQYYETTKAPLGSWSKEPRGTAGIDFLIGESEYLKRGYGSRMVKKSVSVIRNDNKYCSIVADPSEDNITAIAVLTKNGFRKQANGLYKLLIE